nr:class I SAM-dependent methyltransferase [Nocardioidaceae bacterium]
MLWSFEPNRFVVEEVTALPAGRALDLACGEGRNALWLAGRDWQVTAVDFSPVA